VSGQLRLPRFEPEMERLVRLPAWERAKLYELAELDLGERQMVELGVRARIAAEYRRNRR
jgi:hypothetical protein